jgi:hypothetical protein
MEPDKDANAPFSKSVLTRLRLSPTIGTNGAAAKVDTKQMKEIHGKWKARMYGLAKEKSLKDFALFSLSTLSLNLLAAAIFSSCFLS